MATPGVIGLLRCGSCVEMTLDVGLTAAIHSRAGAGKQFRGHCAWVELVLARWHQR